MSVNIPDNFEERYETAIRTAFQVAGSYKMDEKHRRVVNAMEKDRFPDFRSDKGDTGYDEYAFKIACNALREIAVGATRDQVENLKREWQEKENPVTATDGSKGQWEFGRRTRLKLYNWLLTGETKTKAKY